MGFATLEVGAESHLKIENNYYYYINLRIRLFFILFSFPDSLLTQGDPISMLGESKGQLFNINGIIS